MRCESCGKEYPKNEIFECRDVPRYLFTFSKRAREEESRKWGSHGVCNDCFDKYHEMLRAYLKLASVEFARGFFEARALVHVKEEREGVEG